MMATPHVCALPGAECSGEVHDCPDCGRHWFRHDRGPWNLSPFLNEGFSLPNVELRTERDPRDVLLALLDPGLRYDFPNDPRDRSAVVLRPAYSPSR